jgi:hypothetical protein
MDEVMPVGYHDVECRLDLRDTGPVASGGLA